MKLSPKIESGNIEYTLKIILTKNIFSKNINLIKLTTQLKWRLSEGNNIAYYYLGVNDDGSISNITTKNYNLSVKNIKTICKNINCRIKQIEFNDGWYKIKIIKKKYENENDDIIILIKNIGVR